VSLRKEKILKIYKKIHSKTSNAIKYIFFADNNLVIEATYIDKSDGKNIICLPSQTSCLMGCKFCHITDISKEIRLRNITHNEIDNMTDIIYNDLNLSNDPKTLLLSFMGCGEPILNVNELVKAMTSIANTYTELPLVRFALATSLPKMAVDNFNKLINEVILHKINLKVHLSLHYTNDEIRQSWMPNSLNIIDSVKLLHRYQKETGNKVEIHYTLIDEVNNNEEDIEQLVKMFKGKNMPIKFIFFNEKDLLDFHASPKDKNIHIISQLQENGIETEYYIPPALDIGGSCGQLLKEYYLKFNKKSI
jgi:23S rRNA (adenine2503-C2)-methyltransferase